MQKRLGSVQPLHTDAEMLLTLFGHDAGVDSKLRQALVGVVDPQLQTELGRNSSGTSAGRDVERPLG